MKKIVLLGLLLSLSTGCGRGWMPCLFRGASCGNGSCIGAAPALPQPQGCNPCVGGNTAGYSSYQGEVSNGEIVSDYSYGGSGYTSGESYATPAIGSGIPMQPLVQPAP